MSSAKGSGRLYWLDAPAEPQQRAGQRYSDLRRGTSEPRRDGNPSGRRPAKPSQPARRTPAGRAPNKPAAGRATKPSPTSPVKPAARKQPTREQPPRQHAARKNSKQRVLAAKSPRSPRPSRFGIGQARSRLLVLVVALLIVLALVLLKVAQLQTAGGEALRMQGAQMWSRTTILSADRGSIFDRNGEELAVSIPAATISVNPKLIDNPDEIVAVLQQLLGFDETRAAELRVEIAAKETGFLYIARQVNPVIGEQLAEMGLPGVNVDDEDRRVLPGGDTGRSVIGMTDIDGIGVGGLELQYGGGAAAIEQGYTDILTGTPGEATREVDQDGRSIAGTEQVTQAPVPGQDLVLTIDRSIQFAAEQALIRQVTGIGAKAGQAIVMDTDTGEVLAMASVLRDTETGEVRVTSRNSAVVDAYEPGSVAKVITMAAALNEGGVTPASNFVVPWRKQYADDLLSDSHQHPDENMSVQQILVESSNIGTIMVKESIVEDAVESRRVHWEYMRRFGLGEPTALNMPGESNGIMKHYDDLWGSERATVAYGQGMSSTAIQLAAAINAIANDGMYVAPRLVQATVEPDGTIVDAQPSATHEVIGPEAAAQMQHMMRAVVCDPNGTGDAAQAGIENFSVAGKTGTGYKPQANGTYFNEAGQRAYYSSFVGFFPAEDPQVTVLVSIDEPPPESIDRFGSTAAAPVFAELAPVIMHERGMVPQAGTMSCDEFNALPPGGY
jgi:cell division protein FtsI (penicillin-binding protein 3)